MTKDEKLLSKALKDFQDCVKNDPEHYKGRRATEKLQKQTNILRTQNLFQWIGTSFILLPFLLILVLAQWFFWKSFFVQESNLANHQYLTESPKATSNAGKQTPNKNKPKQTINPSEKLPNPLIKLIQLNVFC